VRPVSRPRLKWHKLRRRRSDPPFLRENLEAALRAGAACEVDIVFTADGHAFCLHDLTLDAETTGAGAAAQATRAQIETLRQRGTDGRVLATTPLFLDEIVETVRRIGTAAPALVQLDVKADAATVGAAALGRLQLVLGDTAPSFIAGGCDFDLIARLGAAAPGLHLGFDPLDFYPRSCALTKEEFRGPRCSISKRSLSWPRSTRVSTWSRRSRATAPWSTRGRSMPTVRTSGMNCAASSRPGAIR
jgi:glycerophosphoryl diester phosphodiesterase